MAETMVCVHLQCHIISDSIIIIIIIEIADNKKITRISTNSWGISRYQHTMYIILFNFLTNPIKEKLFYK